MKHTKTPYAPILRLLPESNPGSPTLRCPVLRATLTKMVCGMRSRMADGGREQYAPCKGCPTGRANAAIVEVAERVELTKKSAY